LITFVDKLLQLQVQLIYISALEALRLCAV